MGSKITKAQAAERDDAMAKLRTFLKPGDKITTVLRHTSRSGDQRAITLACVHEGEIWNIDFWVARALGLKIDRTHGGVSIGGGGMDMEAGIVHLLGTKMWPNGTPKPHGRRNGQPDSNGGYALKQQAL